MSNNIKIAELPVFDAAEYLKDEDDIAAYLTAMMEDGNPAYLAAAMGDIARARGMTEIAKATGLSRESLYKSLRPNSHPRFDTVMKVCKALGVKLVAQPA